MWHLTPPLSTSGHSFLIPSIITSIKKHTHKSLSPLRDSFLITHLLHSPRSVIDFIIIWMASFWFLGAFIMAFMASPSLSLSPQLKLETVPTISAAPALLPNPSSSPSPELSPDIAPLFPSHGGVVPSPTGSSIPTIPSNPSPPNPDEMVTPGLGSAVSPSGSLPVSSSSSLNLVGSLNLSMFMSLVAYCSVLAFAM